MEFGKQTGTDRPACAENQIQTEQAYSGVVRVKGKHKQKLTCAPWRPG